MTLQVRIVKKMHKRFRVVFVSPRNSLRSVLAQACLAHLSRERFIALSCGEPARIANSIHPAAIQALGSAGIACPAGPPQSWDRLIRSGASVVDYVIALDDEVAFLAPRWPGQPEVATWSFPDVALGNDMQQSATAAIKVLHSLRRRLEILINLPLAGADRQAVRSDVRDLAHLY